MTNGEITNNKRIKLSSTEPSIITPSSSSSSKKWILNAFVMNTPGLQNPGLWSYPKDQGSNYNKIKFWQDLAKKLESAKFTGIFIADVLGPYDVYAGPENISTPLENAAQLPTNDPMLIVPLMAAVTDSIGFGITVSTTYEHPYDLARRFSTLDHLSEGRVGWNIVTSYLKSAAKAHGLNDQIDKETRYRKADEYMDVVYKLWESSWKSDAVIKDIEKNVYTDPTKVRHIHHHGEFYKVDAIHITEPSKQRTPVLFQAGLSPSGREFGSKHAEAIFISGQTFEKVRQSVNDIRGKASSSSQGRDPNSIKIVMAILVIVEKTESEAFAKYEEYKNYSKPEGALSLLGGWLNLDFDTVPNDIDLKTLKGPIGEYARSAIPYESITKEEYAQYVSLGGVYPKIIGDPSTVADKLTEWVVKTGIDGFNLNYISIPETFDDIIEYLLPELRKRGVFGDDYLVPGGTWRENLSGVKGGNRLRDDHYGSQFKWD